MDQRTSGNADNPTPLAAVYETHDVLNQPPELVGYDAYSSDRALVETVDRLGAGWATGHLQAVGRTVGSAQVQLLARQANRFPPELRTHDRFGHRIDQIECHPAWHELMRFGLGQGLHSFAWAHSSQEGAHVARAVIAYLWNQGENGICCPAGMTFASIPVFRQQPELAALWEPRVLSDKYDPRPLPADQKAGATVGMAMTEKQGGSDLRAIQTSAEPIGRGGPGGEYLITGHKWFFSVPQSDVFFILARTARGVSCFCVPGWMPDGRRNRLMLQRLKDKCGNRSNASSEVEFRGAWGQLVGEEGAGIRGLIEMVHLTRLDCAVSSAGLMRQSVRQAVHHAVHRRAFQKALVDHALMRNVLADIAVEAEAAMALAFRMIVALDRSAASEAERLLARIGAPIAKYWICKRVSNVVVEALECHGGNGFIEEHLMARLYREAPLNGIWEGTGNVICLDVLRSAQREPASVSAFLDEVRRAGTAEPRLNRYVSAMGRELADPDGLEDRARTIVEMLATAMQASLLLRYAPPQVADAFTSNRLDAQRLASGRTFGTLPRGMDTHAIVKRAQPGA